MEISNIQAKKIAEGKEFKREDLSELISIGAAMESYGIPALGEYKNYSFEIDEKYNVTIKNKEQGNKPIISAEVITTGSVLTGEKVEIKVTATINEGTITNIEATNGAILKEDAQASSGEKIFEVSTNGTYYFKATADNGRTAIAEVTVDLITEPVLIAKDITLTAPSGWDSVYHYLDNLSLREYRKMKITFSYTAGWDWSIALLAEDGENYWVDGSAVAGHLDHSSVPTTTRIYDIPTDKNYTKIRFEASSQNAVLQVDEVYLIK